MSQSLVDVFSGVCSGGGIRSASLSSGGSISSTSSIWFDSSGSSTSTMHCLGAGSSIVNVGGLTASFSRSSMNGWRGSYRFDSSNSTSRWRVTVPSFGFQILKIFHASYPTRYPIYTRSSTLYVFGITFFLIKALLPGNTN